MRNIIATSLASSASSDAYRPSPRTDASSFISAASLLSSPSLIALAAARSRSRATPAPTRVHSHAKIIRAVRDDAFSRTLDVAAVIALAITLVVALTACGSSSTTPNGEPDPLSQIDTSRTTDKPVDGAPANHLIRARLKDDAGHRTIEHFDGTSWAPFFGDTERLIPLDMEASYRDGHTLVCTHATPQTDTLEGIQVICAVRADGAPRFEARGTVEGEPNAWLHDVCIASSATPFTLLVSSAPNPFPSVASPAKLAEMPCSALVWNGSAWQGQSNTACKCDQLDGNPCTDPCFAGTGTMHGGSCDTSALSAKCDDNNAATADYCTGDATDLCLHELGADLLPH